MSIPPKGKTTPLNEVDQSWINHVQSEIQKEPARLEETAKFLVGIIGVSLTLFITKRPEGLASWTSAWLIASSVIWMFSVLLSFFVLYPWRYSFNEASPEDIKRAYQKITRTKRRFLVLSLSCFFLALGIAVYAFLAG